LAGTPERLGRDIAGAEAEVGTAQQSSRETAEAERTAEAALRAADALLARAVEALAAARETRAGAAARAENQDSRRVEMSRISGERFECPPPLLPQAPELR
jgi:chromosome segregation protein